MNILGLIVLIGIIVFVGYQVFGIVKTVKDRKKQKQSNENISNRD